MKKTILSFSIVTTLLLLGCGSSSKSNTEKTVIKNPDYLILSYTYDKGIDGTIEQNLINSYNKENKVTKSISTIFNADKNTTYTKTYSYDKHNNLTKEIENDSRGYIWISDYSYDENHNLIKEIHLDNEDNSSDVITYTYDELNNRLTKNEDYNADGSINYYTNYSYNLKNLLLKEVVSTSDKSLLSTINYTYDKNSNLLSEIENDFDGEISNSIHGTYDSENNLIKQIKIYYYSNTKTTTNITYDKNRRYIKILELEDEHNNGIVDANYQWDYTYEDNKHAKLSLNFDNDNDGSFDDIMEVTFLLVPKKENKNNTSKQYSKSTSTLRATQKTNPNFRLLRK